MSFSASVVQMILQFTDIDQHLAWLIGSRAW
jgi:hypothetical protein